MFSLGQSIFAILFIISFSIIIFYSYKIDHKNQRDYFKGSYKVILFMIGLLISLFLIKLYTQK
ncbi:MAG: hypothetical protein CMC21_04425 [Flavobacteriaceae bacterium]|nr:hypothetical protein [Flavobacteriaceae bacterium]